MLDKRRVKILLLIAASLFTAAFAAHREGGAHEQSGFCVIDPFITPPAFGFEHWSAVGVGLAVFALGITLGCINGRET